MYNLLLVEEVCFYNPIIAFWTNTNITQASHIPNKTSPTSKFTSYKYGLSHGLAVLHQDITQRPSPRKLSAPVSSLYSRHSKQGQELQKQRKRKPNLHYQKQSPSTQILWWVLA